MTTLLESMGFFSDMFDFFLPFLLIFATVYAILLKTKALTEDPNINAAIAFALALIGALGGEGKFIMGFAPFMATLFIILFFMILLFLFFGVKLEDVMKSKGVVILIVIICLIFVFYVLGQMYGGSFYKAGATTTVTDSTGENVTVTTTPTSTLTSPRNCDATLAGGTGSAVVCIITHPKVLGAIVLLGLLAIATFFVVYVPKR